jgi:hypothetical protein
MTKHGRGERALRQMIRDIELGGDQESLRCAQTVCYRAERVGGSSRIFLRHAVRVSVNVKLPAGVRSTNSPSRRRAGTLLSFVGEPIV